MTTIDVKAQVAGLPRVEPEAVGLSSERLARVSAFVQARVDAKELPGAVTLVARRGRIAHLAAQGYLDLASGAPMRADAVFRLASLTKIVTSVTALALYERGHYFLDDPIARFLPEFERMRVRVAAPPSGVHVPGVSTDSVPAMRPITIRDCLTHTAGFAGNGTRWGRAGGRLPGEVVGPDGTMRDYVRQLAQRPLVAQPGTHWEYGPGQDVAGVIAEEIEGRTLGEVMQEHIFGPLGMGDSGFTLLEDNRDRFPVLYAAAAPDPDTGWAVREGDRPETSRFARGPRTMQSGGGGLLSTAADLARFCQMLLDGGALDGARILGRKTVELMTTNQIGDLPVRVNMGAGHGYGLGVYVRTNLHESPAVGSVGTYGWGGATGTWCFIDPRERLFGIVLQQVRAGQAPQGCESETPAWSPRRLTQRIEQMVYQAIVD